jgi:hypothetical protein
MNIHLGLGQRIKLIGVLSLAVSIVGLSFIFDINHAPTASAAITSPTFIQKAETAWGTATSPKTTASFNVQAGDVLVAFAETEDASTTVAISDSTTTSTAWVNQQTVNVASYDWAGVWTKQVTTAQAMTVTFTASGNSANFFGGNVLTFRGSIGVGASVKANVSSGAPTVNLITTQVNSAIVVADSDWSAADGTSRVWRTNAGAFSEQSYSRTAGHYTVYGGYHPNAGAVGTYALGLTAPSQKYSIIAVEVKGKDVTPDTTPPTVSMTAPANGATVSGSSVTVSATASDNVGVAGVQFKLDGGNLGAEVTTSPYSVTWNTTSAANGSHTLSAVARDAAGNTATAVNVSVTVANPPVISGISASSITQTSAVIGWTTNIPSSSQVNYGTTTAYGSSTTLDTTLVTSHSQSLASLTASTVYHYQVVSKDATGVSAASADNTFTTATPPDTTPPTVSMTAPANGATVSGSNVTVSATASDNVGVVGVQFSLDSANLGAEVASAPYSVNWNTTSTANGAHTLAAKARDAAGNNSTSSISVTVSNPPQISGVSASSITQTSAVISWTTNIPADSQVNYGTTTAYGSSTVLVATLVTSHSQTLSGLSAQTIYHYQVLSKDSTGALVTSGDNTFTTQTPPDTTPPTVSVSSPSTGAAVSGTITVSANASDNVGVVGVQFKLDGANLGTEVTTSPYSVSWNTTTSANGAHTLTATARDAAGNTTTSSAVNVTVSNPPVISSFTAAPQTITVGSSTTLTWSVSGNPTPTLSIDNGIGAVSGISVVVSPSTTTTYTLTATNSGGTVTAQTTVTVNTAPPITLKQKVSNISSGATSISAVLPSSVTSGDLIIVSVSGWPSNGTVTVSDSLSNAYVPAGNMPLTSGGAFSAIYYAKNVKAGSDTITFGTGVGGTQLSFVAAEFSGIDTASPLDTQASATGSSNAPTTGNMTPALMGELIIGAGTHDTSLTTSVGSGFSLIAIATEDSSSHQPLAMEYKVANSTTATAATFSLSASTGWAQAGAAFRPAGSGPITYSISGSVTPASVGANSTLTLSGAAAATTTADASGNYTFSGLSNGAYVVTPSKINVTFTPTSQSVTISNASASGVNFTATANSVGIQLVQKNFNGNELATANMSASFTSNNTAGNFLIVSASAARPASSLTISDTAGDTFVPAYGPINDPVQNVNLFVWYVQSAKGGPNTVTITPPAAAALEIHLSEWSGMPANAVVDQTANATGSGNAVSTPATTTTANGELVFGYTWVVNVASAGSGFTPLSLINGDLDEYQVQPAAGSVAATFNEATAGGWLAIMVTFKAAGPVISGNLTSLGSGATVKLSGPSNVNLSTTADASGNYIFSGLTNGAYTITPSSPTAGFTPFSQSVTVNGSNVSGVNFTAAATSNLVFYDNFTGASLNPAWTVISRHGEYSQNETECNTPGQVVQASGYLTITTIAQSSVCGDFNPDGTVWHAPQSWPYTTGDLQWKNLNFTYGTVEIRAKFPSLSTSLWPATWLLNSNCQATNPMTGETGVGGCPGLGATGYTEIDMTECYTGSCQFHIANPNFGAGGGCNTGYPGGVDTSVWHTFKTVWTSTSISQYMDGVLETSCSQSLSNPMFLIMQIQTGGTGGTPVNSLLPATLMIDYVKVTQ